MGEWHNLEAGRISALECVFPSYGFLGGIGDMATVLQMLMEDLQESTTATELKSGGIF
jgi:hypothetical protein